MQDTDGSRTLMKCYREVGKEAASVLYDEQKKILVYNMLVVGWCSEQWYRCPCRCRSGGDEQSPTSDFTAFGRPHTTGPPVDDRRHFFILHHSLPLSPSTIES